MANLAFALPILCILTTVSTQVIQKECERINTCRNCGSNKYSYYKCPKGSQDCFSSEVCVSGFCCPRDISSVGLGTCPDSSSPVSSSQCVSDSDCSLLMANCVEGRCCPSCRQRRTAVETSAGLSVGVFLPQCELDGRRWLAQQCHSSINQCWCVTEFGKEIPATRFQSNYVRDCLEDRRRYLGGVSGTVCTYTKSGQCPLVSLYASNPIHGCSCDSDCIGSQKCCLLTNGRQCTEPSGNIDFQVSRTKPGLCPNSLGTTTGVFNQCNYDDECSGSEKCCTGPFGRRCTLPADASQCTGSNEEWTTCRNVCEPDCSEPTRSPCPSVTCIAGCQCQSGYIRREPNLSNSPCILPAQCPLTTDCGDVNKQYQSCGTACPVGCDNVNNPPGICTANCVPGCYYSRKEYRQCGTNCPIGCDRLTNPTCTLQCVSGCFCKDPYILEDADDKDSRCVLKSECRTCTDPKKEWKDCGSSCPSACDQLNPICAKNCVSGCFCRSPYVLESKSNRDSRCILEAECPSVNSCTDPLKEYLTCGSACPIACDNLNPQLCTPCQSGCYCRSGYVFEKSSEWRAARCVRREDCTVASSRVGSCPLTVTSQGQFCEYDSQCPPEQKCCAVSASTGLSSSRRCTCSDPNAEYQSCGTHCPDYCGRTTSLTCGSTCKQGCFCRPGYIRLTNSQDGPCVLISQCPGGGGTAVVGQVLSATAEVRNNLNTIRGTVRFNQEGGGVRVTGQITGLVGGEHGLTIHEFGDVSSDCINVGEHFNPSLRQHGSPSDYQRHVGDLGNINAPTFGVASINLIDNEISFTGINSIIGRSVVIHDRRDDLGRGGAFNSKTDGNSGRAIACGTIGISR